MRNDSTTLSPRRARATLLVLALVATFLIAVTQSSLRSGFADGPSRGPGDVELYRAEVDRIAGGQPYYTAAAAELRSRGYPTRSIFNWRTPAPMAIIGAFRDPNVGKLLICAAAFALLGFGFAWMHEEAGMRAGVLTGVLLTGALLPCVLGDLFVMPEIWSGVLIALSAAAYGTERRRLGVVVGLAALVVRELAAPYCLVCVLLAATERRRGELAAWAIGFAVYAIGYTVHLSHVLPLIHATDIAHPNSWMRFGAAGFVISTVQMNVYLLLLPQWVTALYLALALLGFAAWNTPSGRRATLAAAAYLVAFAVVGHDFNQYWGSMVAPLFCFGAARGAVALVPLVRTALIRQPASLPLAV